MTRTAAAAAKNSVAATPTPRVLLALPWDGSETLVEIESDDSDDAAQALP